MNRFCVYFSCCQCSPSLPACFDSGTTAVYFRQTGDCIYVWMLFESWIIGIHAATEIFCSISLIRNSSRTQKQLRCKGPEIHSSLICTTVQFQIKVSQQTFNSHSNSLLLPTSHAEEKVWAWSGWFPAILGVHVSGHLHALPSRCWPSTVWSAAAMGGCARGRTGPQPDQDCTSGPNHLWRKDLLGPPQRPFGPGCGQAPCGQVPWAGCRSVPRVDGPHSGHPEASPRPV